MDGLELRMNKGCLHQWRMNAPVHIIDEVFHEALDMLRRRRNELGGHRIPVVPTDPVLHGTRATVLFGWQERMVY
jgi:hypothetical protein